jgi:biotin transporter BioY
MNGMMAIVFAFVIGSIDIEKQAKKIIAYGTVATIWGNAIFYIVGVLAPNHGITLGDNRLGESNWAGVVAFIPAYIVALVLIYVVVTLIKAVDKQTGN